MVLAELIGESRGIAAVREQVARLVGLPSDAGRLPPVLVQGETGTGKGLVARALHAAGPRRSGPFVEVNCAAIPETLLEAEMFGVERGAFTGADRARPGLFQAAHRGTLFLDEIGLVPESVQSKLLKAIEERSVRRLGRATSEAVDVWIVAAASEELAEAVRAGRFRPDLYHRLNVLTLRLPPLRQRGGDVVLLAEHFLRQVCADYGLPQRSLSDAGRAALLAHGWPGNVRELANVMERAALLADQRTLDPETLGLADQSLPVSASAVERGATPESGALKEVLETAERERLVEALHETNGNLSHAAARLQIPRNTLRYRMERLGLRVPPPSRRPAGGPAAPTPAASPAPGVPGSAVAPPGAPTQGPTGAADAADVVRGRPAAAGAPSPSTGGGAPASPSAGGERRRLTWLRADLDQTPADVPEVDASRAVEMFAEKISSFGGAIAAVDGARVTAAFGLEPIEDAPRRAALAALAALKAAARARREGEWARSATVAIHVHDCVLVAGDRGVAVERVSAQAATRILDALLTGAPHQAVVTTEAGARHLERRFELEPLSAPDGAAGLSVYRLTGLERPGLGPAGRITRFVGRGQELGLLESRLASTLAGRGHVVAITGEPGIGKTRLLYELQQRFGAHDLAYLEGRCVSYASAIPYLPVVDLVRQYCGVTGSDGPETTAAKGVRALQRLDMMGGDDALYLLQLLGVTRDPAELRDVNPHLMKARTFEVVREILVRESRRRPLVLAIEDLHWIDRTSDELLALLIESVPAAPILLVATYRPGYQPSWLARSYVTQVALSPLSSEDSRVVLTSALPGAPVAADVANRIVARAEGNPFFLEELARAVGGRAPSSPAAVPDTIQSVLIARIGQLPEEDRRALQGAAVIGRDFPLSMLEAVTDTGEPALGPALQRLQAAEFIHETRSVPEVEYAFKHALTHDVAYDSLPPDRRRALHTRTVRALLDRSPDTADRRPEIIARHLSAGESPADAVGHWLRAGRKAIQRLATVEGISHLRTGLDLVATKAPSRERDREELALHAALGPALVMTKGYAAADVERVYERAQALSEGLADMPQRFSALIGVLGFRLVRGDLRAAQETGEQLLSIARAAQTPEWWLVQAHFALGLSLHHRGQLEEARAHFRESIARYDPARDVGLLYEYGQDPWVGSMCYLAYGQALQGYEAESLRTLDAVLRQAADRGRAFSHACALYFGAVIHELRREFQVAGEYADRQVAIAREHRFLFWLAGGLLVRGRVLAAQGRYEEGLALMNEALGSSRATGAWLAVPFFLTHIAEAHLLAGNTAAGLSAVADGLAIAARDDQPNYVPELLRIRGELIAMTRPGGRDAEPSFEQSISLASQQRSRVLARRAAESFAGYLRARGRSDEADRMLADLERALAFDPLSVR